MTTCPHRGCLDPSRGRAYNTKSFAADLQPAIATAEHGFRVDQDFQQLTESALPLLQAYPASHWLLTQDGHPLPVGFLLRNPDLARTYRLLARYGPAYLYDGPLGQAIVQADDHPAVTPATRWSPCRASWAVAEPVRRYGGSALVVHPLH